ncbi:restriction endonuclease subunit S [Flavobacterium columnare]|uniref:N-6 DNA methylase n=1 Tax=Flavobacterium columnare (strain ATCC 49512 / CIP 103533 / TG 44/87) TaxID=1041826 RepID=G8XBE4_FLACA|nr:N-6 DNA methylase [Flavobacterium columnare]AEW86724.1 N-6 DNA methylase [Flavobacterium columnare ATCC 49512]MBF6652424.1 restriction endonuclease subunit S [Flavobacterium columnare]
MKKLAQVIGFQPKENAKDVFIKKYQNGYIIEIDFEKELIDYGNSIKCESKTTQNFSQAENFVVLECVNRLLEKGYKPENITLEKTWAAGHGSSGRLDICVAREDGSEYLLIECKTHGKEFEKEFTRMKKDGGQLFTYFKFSNKADVIMLYSSELKGKEIVYRNEIVKIEEDYRSGDVKDFYQKWNKLTKDNGVFESWVDAYNFESKALTAKTLKPIQEEDSSLIFNQFLEILRHNVVSDKPNAFNKIFTLFLCKVYDEKTTKPNEELKFQWIEGKDTSKGENAYVDFLIRLSDLYKNGMLEFLEKEITDFSEVDFERKYKHLDDSVKKDLLKEFNKIRLEKNNEFAIKEVFDKQSFLENGKIVKEVVELLQGFRIRYNKRQQYLSNFFELLLTTGLKQESGQFFTPVPIAQFIIKSLPFDKIIDSKIEKGERNNLLPYIIDYAAGSGHFLTESMHEIQKHLDEKNPNDYINDTSKKIKSWQEDHFDWATQYVYGIEKDYRLVKVGKVGCYLHGDGLANVLLSDGLGSFKNTKEYKELLKITKDDFPQDNGQFDILISNPPYSVSSFKRTTTDYYTNKDFELYDKLTDNSSEIECLFIERTKQLLKDGGVAGIILPSSILSNTGIYSKSREIILKYFDIVGITELGSNTFMATGTNTVTLFLRRRNNYESKNLKIAVDKFFTDFQDVTLNGIEKPVNKYINHVWENISFEDYVSLLKKEPNKTITEQEIYKEYQKKLKTKNDKEFWNLLLDREAEKLFYFIIAYPQKVVLVKSGEKDAEKRFLGYEFSNRRGSEGIHPIQRGKHIEDCTQLFDAEVFDNPTKASTYIYKAFAGDYDFAIDKAMQNNVSRHNLVDMLTFDRVEFEKNISLSVKKKVNIESKWELKKLGEILETLESGKRPKGGVSEYQDGIPSLGGEHISLDGTISLNNMKFVPEEYFNQANQGFLKDLDVLICKDGALTGKTSLFVKNSFPYKKGMINEHVFLLRTNKHANQKYLFNILYSKSGQELLKINVTGTAQGGLNRENLLNIQIPLPPIDIQQKIVSEIEVLEAKEKKAKDEVEKQKENIKNVISKVSGDLTSLSNITSKIGSGATPLGGEGSYKQNGISLIRSQNVYDNEFYKKGLAFIDEIQAEKLKGVTVEKNDILFNITGASICRCCIVPEKYLPARVNQHVSIIRVTEKALPKYVQTILVSEIYKNQLLEIGDGATSREAITKQQLEDFKIPLPTISEQQKIVSEIEEIEEKIKVLETEITEIPKQKEAILKKYL